MNRTMSSRSPLLLPASILWVLALSSCAAIPRLEPAPVPRGSADMAAERSFGGTDGRWPEDRWWAGYGDPQLASLIEEGIARSPDVAAAAARFRRADALVREEASALRPTLDATAQAGLEKQSYNQGLPKEFVPKGWQDRGEAALRGRFDIDLWGRNRAAVAAARGGAEAVALDARQARLMLATGIADAYFNLALLREMRDLAQRALDLRLARQRLVADRERNGLETRGNVRLADATVAAARADLAAADEAVGLRRNQLAALVGAGPDRGLAITAPRLLMLSPQRLPANATTDLAARRPDVMAALARTRAAADRIKVARADFFPALNLTALVGVQSLGLDELLRQDSTFGAVAPAISLPIFRGGALSGRYRGARAMFDEAVADYDRAVLSAYREIADVVTSRRMLDARLTSARAALAASEQAYSIGRLRHEGGLSTFLDVLDLEDRLLAARRAAAELDARAFLLDVALIRALGGGLGSSSSSSSFATKDSSPG